MAVWTDWKEQRAALVLEKGSVRQGMSQSLPEEEVWSGFLKVKPRYRWQGMDELFAGVPAAWNVQKMQGTPPAKVVETCRRRLWKKHRRCKIWNGAGPAVVVCGLASSLVAVGRRPCPVNGG